MPLVALHVPDGFLDGPTSLVTAAGAVGALTVALRLSGHRLAERHVPVAGLVAAFVFALQMLNFPVAAGTSGHLVGGVLAAVLLGPATAVVVMTVVLGVQALVFADGGLTALGTNMLLMGVVTAVPGYGLFRALLAVVPRRPGLVAPVAGVAAGFSVVLAALAFSLLYAVGGQGGADPAAVTAAMTAVHTVIGVGEGVITAFVVSAVMRSRPDLVLGAPRPLTVPARESSARKPGADVVEVAS